MPKRSTHTYASEENDDVTQLVVYYCLYCGQTAVILDTTLESLPKRKTDASAVLETKGHKNKLMLEKGEQKLIKRSGGYERQFRLNCAKCELPIAYQSKKELPEHVFLLDGALSIQPKVSFTEDDIPPCIQPTKSGDVKMKIQITIEGPRCILLSMDEDTVKLQVKDCQYLGKEAGNKKQNELMMMFLQKTLGLATKDQIKVDMGANLKTKVLMIKDIPPTTVVQRLQKAMEMAKEVKYGAIDRHGQATADMFERMPSTDGETFGSDVQKKKRRVMPTVENPFPDQPVLPSGSKR